MPQKRSATLNERTAKRPESGGGFCVFSLLSARLGLSRDSGVGWARVRAEAVCVLQAGARHFKTWQRRMHPREARSGTARRVTVDAACRGGKPSSMLLGGACHCAPCMPCHDRSTPRGPLECIIYGNTLRNAHIPVKHRLFDRYLRQTGGFGTILTV